MEAYLEKVKAEFQNFPRHKVKHIDREDNSNADVLAKLATNRDAELLRLVPIEIIPFAWCRQSIQNLHGWMISSFI